MFKIKHERTADCVVAGYRVHKSGDDAIGSLLLGLYTDDGTLASVGVIGAFPMAKRRQLFTEMQPLVTTFDDHPWNWAAREAGDRTPRKNETSGWNAARICRSYPCGPSGWWRSATTTWKANGSATPHNSTAGAPIATHAHAPTPNSSSRSRSASATSFLASANRRHSRLPWSRGPKRVMLPCMAIFRAPLTAIVLIGAGRRIGKPRMGGRAARRRLHLHQRRDDQHVVHHHAM